MNNKSVLHEKIVDRTLLQVGSRPDCRVWANDTGIAINIENQHIMKYGLVGSADIIGILRVQGIGVMICFEVKTGRAVQNKNQKAFEKMVNAFGGFYFLIREGSDVTACVEFAIKETIARITMLP